ncbi:MAG: ribosome maturation factor RimM [Sandaracinaceae bacterium]
MTGGADRLVALGVVSRPHGVRGELRVHRFNPASGLLLAMDRVWLGPAPARAYAVESARAHGDAVLLRLAGVGTREAADELRGAEVSVPRARFPAPDAEEVYHVDLVGLLVVEEGGKGLGTVEDVLRYPSVDCLLVREEAGWREVPILEPYVIAIDADAGRVTVAHVEDFELRRPRRGRLRS